jgi:hypothetical protein
MLLFTLYYINYMPSLSRLNFGQTSLLVRVENIYIDYYREDFYDYSGTSRYMQTGPATIKGTLTLNNIYNSIRDIQSFLSTEHDYHLEMDDKGYEIYITNASSTADVRGNVTYRCDFVARYTEINAPAQNKEENTVMWDSGSSARKTFLDMQQLTGVDDLFALEKEAIYLIEKQSIFCPNVKYPTPSVMPGASFVDDIAAVIAGTKPATIVDEIEIRRSPLAILLISEAIALGLSIESIETFRTRKTQSKSLAIGQSYNVDQIAEIMRQAVKYDNVNDHYYWRMGKLLGHPEETICEFINNVKDFGFNCG